MPFHEKSAWIMILALILASSSYLGLVQTLSNAGATLAPPTLPAIMKFTIVVVLIAIVGHIIVAVMAPGEADEAYDERERQIMVRAGHYSGYVFGFGVISALISYLILYNGDLLFYGVFASLVISQIVEYAIQIILYRTSL